MKKGIFSKQRIKAHIIGDQAVRIVRNTIPVEWVARELVSDYGIDLEVEIFEQINVWDYMTTGEHLYIQVKGKKKIEIDTNNKYKKELIKHSLETSELLTVERMGSALIVLLFIVDIREENIFFVCLNDYLEKKLIDEKPNYREQNKHTIYISEKNKIDKNNIVEILSWYGKRINLYSFFNKISFLYSELNKKAEDYESYIEINRKYMENLLKSEIWNNTVFSQMGMIHEEINEFQKSHFEKKIKSADKEEKYEVNSLSGKFNEEQYENIEYIESLWKQLKKLGEYYELTRSRYIIEK